MGYRDLIHYIARGLLEVGNSCPSYIPKYEELDFLWENPVMGQKIHVSNTGHVPLKWGTIAFLVGYAVVFASGLGTNTAALIVGSGATIIVLAGAVTWVVGLVMRITFNRKSAKPLLFTAGEKIALIGIAVAVVGILLINGGLDEDGQGVARIVGVLGFVVSAGGALWHLLTPRQRSATK